MNIQAVQQALNDLGQSPPLTVDGVMGNATKAAIMDFQNAHGLTVDGIAGNATANAIARALRGAGATARGVLVAMAAVLDCTDWDTPAGGWVMPPNVGPYMFFQNSAVPQFPGGGYCADPTKNKSLPCGHVQVPADPTVIAWVKNTATAVVKAAPAGTKFYCLLIRGLTMGNDLLSELEYEQRVLTPLGIECEIVSEGLFAHDLQAENQAKLLAKAQAGYQIMIIGHSMGGDEVCAICQALGAMVLAV